MRIQNLSLIACALFAAAIHQTNAQVLSGQQLEISPSGSDQVSAGAVGGAIGNLNSIAGLGNFAAGTSNSVAGSSSAAFGTSNQNSGDSCVTIGGINRVYTSSEEGSASSSLAVGVQNTLDIKTSSSLAVGYLNNFPYIEGGSITASTMLGTGLYSTWSNATIVGKYNDTIVSPNPLFIIGNGTAANNRSNALEVYASGEIRMAPQGDIPMGEFGE